MTIKHYFFLLLFALPCLLEAQNHIVIDNGSFVRLSHSNYVTFNNTKLHNEGTLKDGSGTVIMMGTGSKAQASIGGSGTTDLYNLEIDKTANDAQLLGNIEVERHVIMSSGNLDLNGYQLKFGYAPNRGIIGESETTRIYDDAGGGEIFVQTGLSSPNQENPANIGLAFTTPGHIGLTQVRRKHTPQTLGGDMSIERYFEVVLDNVPANIDLDFHYFDAELNGLDESKIGFWNKTNPFNPWQRSGKSTNSTAANVVSLNSAFAAGSITLGYDAAFVAPKVCLQGAYNTGSGDMNAKLSENMLLPSTEPYTALGYTGLQNTGENHSSMPVADPLFPSADDPIDWVLVEVRDVSDPSIVVTRRAAILRRDGNITADPHSLKPVPLEGVNPGNYHIAIRHRNHLGVMTGIPVILE